MSDVGLTLVHEISIIHRILVERGDAMKRRETAPGRIATRTGAMNSKKPNLIRFERRLGWARGGSPLGGS